MVHLNKIPFKKFDLVHIASGATHAMLPHENRIFYWNPLYDIFEPIYYDGNVEINYFKLFQFMNSKDWQYFYNNFKVSDIDNLINEIDKIDNKKFIDQLRFKNLKEVQIKKSDAILNQLKKNLNYLRVRLNQK